MARPGIELIKKQTEMLAQSHALWAFEEDIVNRSWLDWLSAHISLGKPLHQYEGVMSINVDFLSLTGRNKKTNEDFSLRILKKEIEQLYLGFDNAYNATETRTLGLTWLPLRILFRKDKEERKLYLILDYHFGKTNNQEYFEFLKEWVS